MLNKVYDDSFSLRKIDVKTQVDLDFSLDKVKILDFSNSIDNWEQELLFSENGFYSLKGKEVENKTKEFYKELKSFVSSKLSELKLKDTKTLDIVSDIKDKKLSAILEQMQNYEKLQLQEWETQVFEQGLKTAIKRAVAYKDNEQIVFSSLNNGISILKAMAEKETWEEKVLNSKISSFQSEFFINLINAYIENKDLKAIVLFDKYKDKLNLEDKEKMEEALSLFKNKIIAYNWAKELFSYNLSDLENKKEINEIKDIEIKTLVQKLLKDFQEQKKKQEERTRQEKNEENWKQIISSLEQDPDKAFLCIDIFDDKKHCKSKENYIKTIIKNGKIATDKNTFFKLLEEIFLDFSSFKEKSLSDYREVLSKEDFELITKLQKMSGDELNFYCSDYEFLKEKFEENQVNDIDKIYSCLQLLISLKNDYCSKNKMEPDFEIKEKLINLALSRFIKKDREE